MAADVVHAYPFQKVLGWLLLLADSRSLNTALLCSLMPSDSDNALVRKPTQDSFDTVSDATSAKGIERHVKVHVVTK